MFEIVLKNLVTLTLCLLVGFVCQKRGLLNKTVTAGLSMLLMNVILPCSILTSLDRPMSYGLLLEAGFVCAASFGIYFLGAGVAWVLCRLLRVPRGEAAVYCFGLTFPNVAYMGFPVLEAALGPEALFYASVCTVSFNILAFTFGVRLMTSGHPSGGRVGLKKILLTPAIPAIALGLVLFLTSRRPPQPVDKALTMLAGMMTPVSMIIIGALLAQNSFRALLRDAKLYGMLLAKLLLIPILVFALLQPFLTNRLVLGVLVLTAAMPAASITAIFAEQYQTAPDLASRFVFATTILSILAIPLVTLLLG
jgi:predicted permease